MRMYVRERPGNRSAIEMHPRLKCGGGGLHIKVEEEILFKRDTQCM